MDTRNTTVIIMQILLMGKVVQNQINLEFLTSLLAQWKTGDWSHIRWDLPTMTLKVFQKLSMYKLLLSIAMSSLIRYESVICIIFQEFSGLEI